MSNNTMMMRKLRKIGSRNIHIPIKIEDDSEEEEEKKTIPMKGIGVERSTQTSSHDMLAALKKLVRDQIEYNREKYVNDERSKNSYDPCVKSLMAENDELRTQANVLRVRLEELEKNTLKRRSQTEIPNSSVSKVTLSSIPASQLVNGNDSPLVKTNIKVPQGIIPQQNIPIVPRVPAVQSSLLRTPMQMISPVRHAQPGQGNEQFILVDGSQIIGSALQGVNTQVVAANQGLRMTSIPPGLRMQPINTSSTLVGSVQTNGQRLFHNPNILHSNMHWQQRPIQQQQQQQQQHRRVDPQMFPTSQPILKPTPVDISFGIDKGPNIARPYNALPKLKASITANGTSGIILTWDYDRPEQNNDRFKVECYQLFAHQAKDARIKPPSDVKRWKKIGVVNALPLPMACTLTQFATGNVYFFGVVAVDIHGREGEMSNPCIIRLNLNS